MPTNAEVLTGLLVEERKGLLRLLNHYLSPDVAEDVYQAIYLKVSTLQSATQIQEPKPYLYRLAYNEAMTHGRRVQSEQRLLADVAELLGEAQEPDTAQVAAAQMELRAVMRAVMTLPQPAREIFSLSVYHDLSERAIAAKLGMSRAGVQRHLNRALERVARYRDKT